MFILITSIQSYIEGFKQDNEIKESRIEKKRSKAIPIGKLCNSIHRKPSKKVQTKNELTIVAGFKVNIQKSLVFLYNRDEQTKNKTKKTNPFTRSS